MADKLALAGNIKVSVIIPAFNNEKHLDECLASATGQIFDNYEIIIINDGSTDNSASIIDSYAASDDRIKVINPGQNKGVSVARNAGIEKARGEYVIFLDADDYWLGNNLIETLYKRAVNDKAELVQFGFCRQPENGRRTSPTTESERTINLADDASWSIKYSVWALLISKELIDRHDIRFDPDLTMGEDALFCCSLYCHANRLSISSMNGYCYRINPESANNVLWSKHKLFCTVLWFRRAIDVIKTSPAYPHRPDILQSLMAERLRMLADRLTAIAFEILEEDEIDEFFTHWAECLRMADHDFIKHPVFDATRAQHYRSIYNHVLSGDMSGIRDTLLSNNHMDNASINTNSITLTREEAARTGKLLLNVRENNVRLNLGNGITVNLSRSKAHYLAKQLIDNNKPRITLNFEK